jgi:hypothetical protein
MLGAAKNPAVSSSVNRLNTTCVVEVPMSMPALRICSKAVSSTVLSGW